MKALKILALSLMLLVLNGCATHARSSYSNQDSMPRSHALDGYLQSQYPEYVSLVRLPDVNTTSKVIRID